MYSINVGLWYVFLYVYVDLSLVCFICCLDAEKSEKNQRADKILVVDSLILYLNSVTHSVRRIPESCSIIAADSDRVMFSGIGYEYTHIRPDLPRCHHFYYITIYQSDNLIARIHVMSCPAHCRIESSIRV